CTFFKPACLNKSAIQPGCAQRNIPGVPGPGGFNWSLEIIVPMEFATQKFFSGALQTEATRRPPVFNTRIISCKASCISGKNIKPNRLLTALKVSSSKGNAETSQQTVSKFFIPFLTAL